MENEPNPSSRHYQHKERAVYHPHCIDKALLSLRMKFHYCALLVRISLSAYNFTVNVYGKAQVGTHSEVGLSNFGHRVNSDIQICNQWKSIRIFTVCLVSLCFYSNNQNIKQTWSLSEFTRCPKLPDFTVFVPAEEEE